MSTKPKTQTQVWSNIAFANPLDGFPAANAPKLDAHCFFCALFRATTEPLRVHMDYPGELNKDVKIRTKAGEGLSYKGKGARKKKKHPKP